MKAVLLIDGSYLYKSVQDAFGIKRPKYPHVAFNIFFHYKVKHDLQFLHLHRVRYHDSMPCESEFKAREKFLETLKNFERFDVILGRCRKIGDSYSQKGVDVNIAIDIVRYSLYVDTIILVSGDSDLIPAIRLAKDRGSEVAVYYSPHHKRVKGSSIDLLLKEADVSETFTLDMVTLNHQDFVRSLTKEDK